MSDSVRPYRQQPTRLRRPWDSPGKNPGVDCHFLLQCMKVKSESEVAQSCLTLATPWTAAHQAPPSMGFSRQEYRSGVPLPSPIIWLRKSGIREVIAVILCSHMTFPLCMPREIKTSLVSLPLLIRVLALSGEKAMASHSSTLAWKIPWTEEPGGLQSMGSLELDTTERLHFHFSLSCIGEGNGNPLQCSCLENPRDGKPGWLLSMGSHRVGHD